MITCASCKNNTSTDRCSRKPLKGLLFCGTHAKVKSPRLWSAINKVDDKVILIQKAWRGYSVRKWIKLAGPGALCRKVCHNEEELVTFDDKNSVTPLDYFAFEEAGKVYWFDVRSILQNSIDKIRPMNPYTREPLSIDTRQRLRKIAILRDARKLKTLHDENRGTAEDVLRVTWTSVCQIIEENGFPDMSPMFFVSLNKTQLYIFAQLMQADVTAWASEHTTPNSRRKRYIPWIRRIIAEYNSGTHTPLLSYITARFLLTMLNDYPEPYDLCFIIMSALHRV
jgi:hypothetical protein